MVVSPKLTVRACANNDMNENGIKGEGLPPAGVSWPRSMSLVLIKLLLGGLVESGHRMITGFLWNVIIAATRSYWLQEKNAQYMY